MENAVKTAEIYTKHSNRKTITSMDILLGLKKEVFTFLDNDDIEERALAIFNKFKNEEFCNSEEDDEEEDEEDEEEDGEEDEEEDEEDEEEERKQGQEHICSCPVHMRQCHLPVHMHQCLFYPCPL